MRMNYLTPCNYFSLSILVHTCLYHYYYIASTIFMYIVLLIDFGHDGQSQRISAICAGDIIVHKCVRRQRCTLCSFTLIIRWGGNPTRSERVRNVHSEGIIPPTFKLRAATEKFILEKLNSTFSPIRESTHVPTLNSRPRKQRGSYVIRLVTVSLSFL